MSFQGLEQPKLSTKCYRNNHKDCHPKKGICECSCHPRGNI